MTIFRGTGTCFEDCTLKFAEMIRDKAHRQNPRFFLVHGILKRPDDGFIFSHAWLELDGKAIEPALAPDGEKIAIVQSVEDFHKNVIRFTRYTWREVFLTAAAHGDIPPPWDPEYRALCAVVHPAPTKSPEQLRRQLGVIEDAIAERDRKDRGGSSSWWARVSGKASVKLERDEEITCPTRKLKRNQCPCR